MRAGITIYFIRHGQTDWNAAYRYQGQRDIPLNSTGRTQARRNGEMLASHLPDPAAVDFVASRLSRATETMQIVRAAMRLPENGFSFDERLIEVHYGHWEGHLAADLPATDPESVAARMRDPFNWRPRGGESYADLLQRTSNWLGSVDRDTVAASHGGVSRTLRAAVLGLDGETTLSLEVPQDRILVLRKGGIEWL